MSARRPRIQPAFDRLFEHANLHAPSAKMADRDDIDRMILFDMLLGVQREIEEFPETLDEDS